MALTRKFLSALGIESDKIDEIISAHADTVDALKEERDIAKRDAEKYKKDADELPSVQKELNDLKTQGPSLFETKFNEMKEERDKLQQEFDDYKSNVDKAEIRRSKESAYRKLLKKANISEKRIDKILKVSEIDKLEVDKDGKLKNEENLSESIKEEWGDFIVQEHQSGASVSTPQGNNAQAPRGESRAAKIAAQYHANLYGEAKEAK